MLCQDIREQLSAYIDGMLDSSLEVQVKLHIASCEGCRLEYQDLTTAVHLLKSLPEIAPPPDFNLKLQEKLANLKPQVEAPRETGLLNRLVRGKWSGPLAAAAVIFLTVGVTAIWYDKQHGDMFNPVVQDQVVDDAGRTRQSNNAKIEPHSLAFDSNTPSSKLLEKTENDNFKKLPQEQAAAPKANQEQRQQNDAGAASGQLRQQPENSTGTADFSKLGSADDKAGSKPGIAEKDQPPAGIMTLKAVPDVNEPPAAPSTMASPNQAVASDAQDTPEMKEAPKLKLMQAAPMEQTAVPHVAREYRATWAPRDGQIDLVGELVAKYDGIIEYEPQEVGQYWVLRLPGANATTFLDDLGKSGSLEVKTEDRDLTDKYHQIENKINELKEREQALLQSNNTQELTSIQQQIQEQSQTLAELNKETSTVMIILAVK